MVLKCVELLEHHRKCYFRVGLDDLARKVQA